jgi:soluble lytic murein transglycosylase-like protein
MTSGNMQINSRWPPVLQQHGISEQTLLDPCTNTYVGAWILARNIDLLSYGWLAAGAYNAGRCNRTLDHNSLSGHVSTGEGCCGVRAGGPQ